MNCRLKQKIITLVSRGECVSVYNMYNLFMLEDYSMLYRSIIVLIINHRHHR